MPRPQEPAVKQELKSIRDSNIPPYEDSGPDLQLMANQPTPGSVVTTNTVPELGVTEWKLSNGARVVVKPTNNSESIRMSAFSPGGSSLVSDADYDSARYAG